MRGQDAVLLHVDPFGKVNGIKIAYELSSMAAVCRTERIEFIQSVSLVSTRT